QVARRFTAMDLVERDLLGERLRVRDDVRLVESSRPVDGEWVPVSQRLVQESGLRWSGGVDLYGAALLSDCDGTRPLGELVGVLAAATGLGPGEVAEQVVPVVHRLVEQGFLVADA
ncbi:MAG: hypothetical protein ACLGIG_09030, partial [Actinomycetes bacterium]